MEDSWHSSDTQPTPDGRVNGIVAIVVIVTISCTAGAHGANAPVCPLLAALCLLTDTPLKSRIFLSTWILPAPRFGAKYLCLDQHFPSE